MGDGHLQELSLEGEIFTPSDVERALWSRAIGEKLKGSKSQLDPNNGGKTGTKRKRKTSKWHPLPMAFEFCTSGFGHAADVGLSGLFITATI